MRSRKKKLPPTALPYLAQDASRRQAADLFAVSISTLDRMRRRPGFPHPYRYGRVIRFKVVELLAYQERCRAG